MTSVPDMGKWTIKNTYRDLEKRVSEVARQPGETQEDVTDALSRILSKKGARVAEIAEVRPRRRSMLVVSNWSAHQLYDRVSWSEEDISPFDVVMLLEFDEVRCIRWKGGIPG